MDETRRSDDHYWWVESRVKSRLTRRSSYEEKVGLIGSTGRAGQAAQAVGSVALPGDLSEWRSPVRSRIYGALTPGSGPSARRLLRSAGGEREYRCPEGYQFGGRFTDSKWSTCGRQLFDLPNILPDLLDLARAALGNQGAVTPAPASGRTLGGAEAPGGAVIQSRQLQIPRVGPMSKQSRENGVQTAIRSLTSNRSVQSMMIRRDGFPMQPVVTTGELRQVPDNRNMEDAAFLVSAANIDSFGADELGLLSNTGVTSLVYVMPNGSTIRMDRVRPLSVGERRKLGKTVSSASTIDNTRDPLARLNAVVADSDGAISLKKNIVGVKNPDETIESGKNKGKPRWVDEAFKGSGKAPSRPASARAETPEPDRAAAPTAEPGERITNLENAIEHINNGGNLGEVDPSILPEAVRRAKVYRQRRLGSGRTLFERTDEGVSFIENQSRDDFEHLGAHLSTRVNEAMGLPVSRVRIAGEGKRRPYFVQTPDSVLPDAKQSTVRNLSQMPTEDLVAILASDYLTDVRGRNPASVMMLESGDVRRAISTNNAPSALSGLSARELEARRNLALEDFLSRDGRAISDALAKQSEELRRQALENFANIIERARAFEWNEYVNQLNVDGMLSDAERRHMQIVKRIFDVRLERLAQSREAFARALGVGE